MEINTNINKTFILFFFIRIHKKRSGSLVVLLKCKNWSSLKYQLNLSTNQVWNIIFVSSLQVWCFSFCLRTNKNLWKKNLQLRRKMMFYWKRFCFQTLCRKPAVHHPAMNADRRWASAMMLQLQKTFCQEWNSDGKHEAASDLHKYSHSIWSQFSQTRCFRCLSLHSAVEWRCRVCAALWPPLLWKPGDELERFWLKGAEGAFTA